MERGKIEVRNLNVHLNDAHILKNINLNIRPRKITAIIGPSGCGKTTLLKFLGLQETVWKLETGLIRLNETELPF